MAENFLYRCIDCGNGYEPDGVHYLCPSCSRKNTHDAPPYGVLKVLYDYPSVRSYRTGLQLFDELEAASFIPLLPIRSIDSLPPLQIGKTPVYKTQIFNNKGETFEVFLKDDSQNPTFSFKDRASALVSAWAKENGIRTIAAASTGNAGSSLAGICAAQGQHSVIFVPASAPVAKLTQMMMYGARVIPVNGSYDDAFDLCIQATEQFGLYNRNTAFNPLTIEGKKTVSFEIFRQLDGKLPDRIFVPVGDGVILSGVYKGFEDLLELGIISKMPVVVAVQAEGSNNLVRNLGGVSFHSNASNTLADSISVDIPRNFRMAAGFLQKYHGESLSVSDEEILDASLSLSRSHGLFTEPASSAAYAGLLKYISDPEMGNGIRCLVLLTGSGLKDLQAVKSRIRLPDPVAPGPSALQHLFIDNSWYADDHFLPE